VEELLSRGLHTSLPAFQAIGYRQLAAYLQGKRTLDAAVEEIIRSTTRYAKRQTTWFRREPDVTWFRPDDLKATVDTLVSFLDPEELGVANGESEH
jgi:tRNA dimethylallyltransferase